MFDIGATELLLCAIIAIVVIGPKDLPQALRTLGRWIARGRKVSRHFRSGLDAMIREAELEDLEKEWAERNARIMKEHGSAEPMRPIGPVPPSTVTIDGDASAETTPPAAPATEGER